MDSEDRTQADWRERLYNDEAARLLLYGRALGLTPGQAEDVLHDTFVAMFQLNVRPARPVHYLVRTYRNRALNYRRSFWRRLAREWESKRWFERESGIDPREEQAMLALARLPTEQREVIVLKIWHQLTFEEIASLQELSSNTVAGRYRYGLEKLRHHLEEPIHEPNECFGGADAPLETPPAIARS